MDRAEVMVSSGYSGSFLRGGRDEVGGAGTEVVITSLMLDKKNLNLESLCARERVSSRVYELRNVAGEFASVSKRGEPS